MSILQHNGATVFAMQGKGCVAVASDLRFGVQAQTISTNCSKVYEVGPRLYVGLSGLATDIQTVSEKLLFRTRLYKLREERDISPKTFASVFSTMLYEKRFGPFFVEPVIAGIDDEGNPYICNMDLLGAKSESAEFCVAGTADEALFGMAESLWRPDLGPDELFETTSQCMLAAVDRSAISGWGAVVTVMCAAAQRRRGPRKHTRRHAVTPTHAQTQPQSLAQPRTNMRAHTDTNARPQTQS